MAIRRASSLGFLEGENSIACAEFIKKVNDWFHVFNVRVPCADRRERTKAYGMSIEIQNSIIKSMTELMNEMGVIGNKNLLPFQKGIIQCNTALPFQDLQKQFGPKYILTYRLNQDVLENFFSVIRGKGGLHDHPDQLEFQFRLRSYIVGHNEGAFVDTTNTHEDSTPDLELIFSAKVLTTLKYVEEPEKDDDILGKEMDAFLYDGLENLAGFICHKFKDISPNISVPPAEDIGWTWTNQLSVGELSKPSSEFMEKIERLEKLFGIFNGCCPGCGVPIRYKEIIF